MDNKPDNEGFQYTYSAKEQAELKRIRNKYTPTEENKMERLRRLDRQVTQKAQTVSLIFGIVGTLILGFGMSLATTTLGDAWGLSSEHSILMGITVGVIGGVLLSLAYPLYNLVIKRERERIAPEIIRLTDELLK